MLHLLIHSGGCSPADPHLFTHISSGSGSVGASGRSTRLSVPRDVQLNSTLQVPPPQIKFFEFPMPTLLCSILVILSVSCMWPHHVVDFSLHLFCCPALSSSFQVPGLHAPQPVTAQPHGAVGRSPSQGTLLGFPWHAALRHGQATVRLSLSAYEWQPAASL